MEKESQCNCEYPPSADDDDDVDPRVQGELENLNSASNEINQLETELEKCRSSFRSLLAESTQNLNQACKKLGKCVSRARPYYELLKESRRAQAEAQRAAVNFQRAHGIYQAAKETVSLAEQRLVTESGEKWEFDSAWQEMLNHATMKFMESEKDKTASEEEHSRRAAEYAAIQQKLKFLEKEIPRSISKARPYFELKEQLEHRLQLERQNVEDLQRSLVGAKQHYRASLNKLESISEEIHRRRKLPINLPPRTPGVGAESCSDQSDLPSINLDVISLSETMSQLSFDEQSLVTESEASFSRSFNGDLPGESSVSNDDCKRRDSVTTDGETLSQRKGGIGAYLAQRNGSFSEGGYDSSDSSPQSSPVLGRDRMRRRRKKLQTQKAFPILQGLSATSLQMSPRLMRANAVQGRFEAVVIENDGSPKQYRNHRPLPWQQDHDIMRRVPQSSPRSFARRHVIATEVAADAFESSDGQSPVEKSVSHPAKTEGRKKPGSRSKDGEIFV